MLHSAGYSASGIQDIVTVDGVPKGSFYNQDDSPLKDFSEVVFGSVLI